MPSLGADMSAGTLVAWLKKPGDAVKRGDIIAEVDTDKGVIEVEVFHTGTIERLLVEAGTSVPVGTPMAVINVASAAAVGSAPVSEAPKTTASARPEPRPATARAPAAATAAAPEPTSLHVAAGASKMPRLRISPSARRLARELGVKPTDCHGTGPGGAITREDVKRAAGASPHSMPSEVDAKTRMRRAIGQAMSRSNRDIPHYYVAHTVDLTDTLAWLSAYNEAQPVPKRLLPAALLSKAVALAAREFPEMNARFEHNQLVPVAAINVGMAISLRAGGLVIPALANTDQLTLAEVMAGLKDLVARARRDKLRSSELAGGTITVTSLGDHGVQSVFGVIFPPQTALVGFGSPSLRPWVVDGKVLPRTVMDISLAADHRASDGHRGGLFLTSIAKHLSRPEEL